MQLSRVVCQWNFYQARLKPGDLRAGLRGTRHGRGCDGAGAHGPRTAGALATAKGGGTLLHERADPLAHVVTVGDDGLREGLLDEQGVDVRLQGAIEKTLREPDRER